MLLIVGNSLLANQGCVEFYDIRGCNDQCLSLKLIHEIPASSGLRHAIVLQLSKCLKFEAIQGVRLMKGFAFKQRDITRPVSVLLFRQWHIIIISFI